jgi:hypothetical protein
MAHLIIQALLGFFGISAWIVPTVPIPDDVADARYIVDIITDEKVEVLGKNRALLPLCVH